MLNFFSRNTKHKVVPAKDAQPKDAEPKDAQLKSEDIAVAEMERPAKADEKPSAIGMAVPEAAMAEAPVTLQAEPAAAPTLAPDLDDISLNGSPHLPVAVKKVINVGCGPYSPQKLHAVFRNEGWKEVRLDINPDVEPDLIGSITDMRPVVADASFDALWSSHNVEHLFAHEVVVAFGEFRRILKPDGFCLITCPDMDAIVKLIAEGGLDKVAYQSPAGPITPLDMLYGFGPAIARGNHYMAHKTGFTMQRIGQLLLQAGFAKAWLARDNAFNLWAVGLMPDADEETIKAGLAQTPQRFMVG